MGNRAWYIQLRWDTSKTITGLKVSRNKILTLQDFNQIQDGQSREDVFNTLDTPNEYSESNVSNQDSEIVSYTAGIKGDIWENFNITFTGGKVSAKSQSSPK